MYIKCQYYKINIRNVETIGSKFRKLNVNEDSQNIFNTLTDSVLNFYATPKM